MTRKHPEVSLRGQKIALVAGPGRALTQAPPVGLAYLAAAVRARGGAVRIFDFKRLDLVREELLQDLVAWRPDVIGFTAATRDIVGVTALVRELRPALPSVPFVLGGAHATALPEISLDDVGIDVVVYGEGEQVFPRLVERLATDRARLEDIPGLVYRKEGAIVRTPPCPLIEDLDTLPVPAWDLTPPWAYSRFTMQLYKRREIVAPILTSRGCPFACTFCASTVHGKKLRLRSPAAVVDEIELLVREHGVGEFLILDDNFTLNRKHALAVCDEIIARRLDIIWKMPQGMRIDTVDDELMARMKRAGCYEVGFGIESGNQELLSSLNKRLDLSIVRDKLRIVKRHGLGAYGFFIIGLPGETKETLRDTLRMMLSGFDHVSLSFCIPYPGSELYADYVRRKGGDPDWDRYAHHYVFPDISGLSEAELRRFWRFAMIRFYLAPARAMGLFTKLRSVPLSTTMQLVTQYLGLNRR